MGDAVSELELQQRSISALRLVGANLPPTFMSLQRREYLYQVMLLSIKYLQPFQALCFCCQKFSYLKVHEEKCPFDSKDCPIHQVYQCDVCHNKIDMTAAPEDMEFTVDYNRREYFQYA